MKASMSRQKSYHEKKRKTLELQEGDHAFLKVTHMTGVGSSLKSTKLTPQFLWSLSDFLEDWSYCLYGDTSTVSLKYAWHFPYASALEVYSWLVTYYRDRRCPIERKSYCGSVACLNWGSESETAHREGDCFSEYGLGRSCWRKSNLGFGEPEEGVLSGFVLVG